MSDNKAAFAERTKRSLKTNITSKTMDTSTSTICLNLSAKKQTLNFREKLLNRFNTKHCLQIWSFVQFV